MVRSTLVVCPTGTGKSVIMGMTASQWPTGRVMVLQHREELIRQNASKISSMCGGEECAIEMADEKSSETRSDRHRVVVASIQSLISKSRGKCRFEKFMPHEFGLIMTDEAHHATAPTYRRIYDWFYQNRDIRHLGVTATPDRADEEALGQIFDSVAFEYQIQDAIRDGWLVNVEQQFVHVEGLDISGCRTNKHHDISEADIGRVMAQEGLLHKIVYPTIELAGDKATLVFAASVEHAHKMAEIFNRHKPHSAVAIDGGTDKEERRLALKRYGDGDFQYLINMGVFLEGFDEPRIEVISMARPTKSRALYAQVAGRGTRPLPGVVDGLETAQERCAAILASAKPSMLMLDFVGNSGRHKLVSTADILGGNESDEVVERATENAKKKGDEGKKTNMQAELALAKEQLEEELRERHRQAAIEAAKRAHVVATAKFNTKAVNPFDIFDIVPKREPGWHKGRKPTDGMVKCLTKFKVDDTTIDKLSFCEAKQMIDVLIDRSKRGLCTVKQAKTLAKYGERTDVPFAEARRLIDAIAANNWKPLTKGNSDGN